MQIPLVPLPEFLTVGRPGLVEAHHLAALAIAIGYALCAVFFFALWALERKRSQLAHEWVGRGFSLLGAAVLGFVFGLYLVAALLVASVFIAGAVLIYLLKRAIQMLTCAIRET